MDCLQENEVVFKRYLERRREMTIPRESCVYFWIVRFVKLQSFQVLNFYWVCILQEAAKKVNVKGEGENGGCRHFRVADFYFIGVWIPALLIGLSAALWFQMNTGESVEETGSVLSSHRTVDTVSVTKSRQ